MVEPRDRLGLDAKPLDRVGTGLESGGPDRFQGDDSAEFLVPGLVNDPHTAGGDHFDQLRPLPRAKRW